MCEHGLPSGMGGWHLFSPPEGLGRGGGAEDTLSEMDALRGKADPEGKGTAIKGSIKGDFLYRELLLAVSVRTDWRLEHDGKAG